MTRTEMLLVILGEEASEVSKEASKCLRFGPKEIDPKIGIPNKDRLMIEYFELTALVEILVEEGVLELPVSKFRIMDSKKARVEKMLNYSKQCGTLQESDERGI